MTLPEKIKWGKKYKGNKGFKQMLMLANLLGWENEGEH